jgi:hypothetical protein
MQPFDLEQVAGTGCLHRGHCLGILGRLSAAHTECFSPPFMCIAHLLYIHACRIERQAHDPRQHESRCPKRCSLLATRYRIIAATSPPSHRPNIFQIGSSRTPVTQLFGGASEGAPCARVDMQLCTPRQCVPHVMGSSLPPHPHPRPGPVRLDPTRGAPAKYAHLAQWHSTQPTPAHQWTQGALGQGCG